MKSVIFGLVVMLCGSAATMAGEFDAALQRILDTSLSTWASDPVLVEAIKQQNTETAALSQANIDEMDNQWRAAVDGAATPTIDRVLSGPAAEFLREQVYASGGAITEAFIMDARGLNVAASEATSDYWQGDEAKFQETYPNGPGAVHFGEVELDESSGAIQSQISLAITDAQTGEVVGALTVGIDVSALM